MNGYKVLVYKLTEKAQEDTSYCRENSEQIYEQKLATLDLKHLIAVVNELEYP